MFRPQAAKDFLGLERSDRERIERRVQAYADDPGAPQHDVRMLVGMSGLSRLRVGDYRIIFERSGDIMRLHRVVHRQGAYR